MTLDPRGPVDNLYKAEIFQGSRGGDFPSFQELLRHPWLKLAREPVPLVRVGVPMDDEGWE